MDDRTPQPIATAPLDKRLLLWWVPKKPNRHAEAWVIGEVSSYEPGNWWSDEAGFYQSLSHITHWLPLPDRPSDSAFGDPHE